MKTVIEGILRCVTPLHHASVATRNQHGDNITRTTAQNVFHHGLREEIPYFKATALRGGLRRAAARIVLNRLVTDQKVSRGLFAGMMTGAESGQPDKAPISVEEVIRAKDNIFIGLFGGGARVMRSRYRPIDMMPVIPTTVDIGMVPMRYADGADACMINARGRDLVNIYAFVSGDDVARVTNINDINAYIENSVEAVAEYQASVLKNLQSRKVEKTDKTLPDNEKTKKIDKSNLLRFEAIAPGVPLYFRLELDDGVTPAQIGLMCQSLADLINEQEFGGWIRAGCGRVTPDLTISVDGKTPIPFFASEKNGIYELNKPIKSVYLSAMNKELSDLTVDKMTGFYTNRG